MQRTRQGRAADAQRFLVSPRTPEPQTQNAEPRTPNFPPLGIRLDLGVLTHQNLIYFIEAVHHGQRLLCRDEGLTNAIVGRAYSLYARLRADRREVEAAYHAA